MTRALTLPVPSEHAEQCLVISWAKMHEDRWPELALLFGTLNGVRLSIGVAKKAKAAGNKAGVPDLWLPVRRGIDHTSMYSGLCIELKRQRGGTVSPEQKQWHEALRDQGYRVAVCKGAEAAIETITRYLTHDLEPDR